VIVIAERLLVRSEEDQEDERDRARETSWRFFATSQRDDNGANRREQPNPSWNRQSGHTDGPGQEAQRISAHRLMKLQRDNAVHERRQIPHRNWQ